MEGRSVNLNQLQASLFDARNLAATVQFPEAPVLVPHSDWPFPGLTPEESAQASLAISSQYLDLVAAVIQSQAGAKLTGTQVLALIPSDWRKLLGRFAHGSIGGAAGEQRGIKSEYVSHDGGGFHFTYQAIGGAA